MKHTLFIFSFFIIFSSLMYGQENKFIYQKKTLRALEKSNEMMQQNPVNLSVDLVSIDLDQILVQDEFLLEFGNVRSLVKKEKVMVRGANSLSLICRNADSDELFISVLGNDVQGMIRKGNNVYNIETVAENEYAIIKIDQSKLNEAHIDSDNSLLMDVPNEDDANSIYSFSESSAPPSPTCKIRVLILYTPAAKAAINGDIKNTALHSIAMTNETFVNSKMNNELELVYVGETNYVETKNDDDLTNWKTNLIRFRDTTDGYMDEVHSLRDQYAADVCVLFCHDPSYCGLGYVKANASTAFCAVETANGCSTTYYTFGHEIGHVVGCRHDTYVDTVGTQLPYNYGHGYVHIDAIPEKSWYTIMAYPNHWQDYGINYCPRIGYWANPNVSYNGTPTGTESTNNTARVWQVRNDTIMGFRQSQNNLTFTSGELSNSLYADIVAKQNVTTSGTIDVNNGSTLHFRAGNNIVLKPGFSVKAGAEFSACIAAISDCGVTSILAKTMTENDMLKSSIEDVSDFSHTIYPNPVSDLLSIDYVLNADTPLSIDLMNILGNNVKKILPRQMSKKGSHSIQVPVSELKKGIYFLVIRSEKQKKIEKIIIN